MATLTEKRLAVLFPPCGAEYEYYLYGERLSPELRVSLMGARYHGGDEEHFPENMRITASLANVLQAARVMKPLQPDGLMWACTSGSFISGLAHAQAQARAIEAELGCPASSTSLAFVDALHDRGIRKAVVLGSYPEQTTHAFMNFMHDAGIEVCDFCALDTPSGPHAADLGDDVLLAAAESLHAPKDAAILVPDTAIPTLHLIAQLQARTDRLVLTANQVSLWQSAKLLGLVVSLDEIAVSVHESASRKATTVAVSP
ncbi:MAG: hypothetical protein CMO26_13105 [Thiotrichales bacterium]|nr:hypothetical protein [Thiotrichales bacterium]|tara:strand:+ start:697 stop:1470 length:774 start_codon:yes stop_codon:yes gene_type:complete